MIPRLVWCSEIKRCFVTTDEDLFKAASLLLDEPEWSASLQSLDRFVGIPFGQYFVIWDFLRNPEEFHAPTRDDAHHVLEYWSQS